MTELADVFSGVKPLTRVEKNGNDWKLSRRERGKKYFLFLGWYWKKIDEVNTDNTKKFNMP